MVLVIYLNLVFQENNGTVIYKIDGDSDYYRKGEGCSILKCENQAKRNWQPSNSEGLKIATSNK